VRGLPACYGARAMLRHPLHFLPERLVRLLPGRAMRLKAMLFALVGVANALVDFGVFAFCHLYLGMALVTANVLAWMVAVTGSYVLNSTVTFAAESGRVLRLRDYLSFAASQVGGLAANTATVVIASYAVPVLLAKVLAIGASFLVNFSLSYFVVFRPRPSPASAETQEPERR
jgi:putative flippase GtrA